MLVKKANEDRVLEIADRLGDLLLNGNDQHRDFACIALKTFVLEVTTMSVSQQILVSLIPQLLGRNKYWKSFVLDARATKEIERFGLESLILVQRKTASFEFSKRSLRNFVMETVQQEIQNRLLPLLQIASETNKTIDLQDIFERFAFDNVCMIAFNHDPSCLVFDSSCNLSSSPFALAFERAANLSAERFRYALPFLWKIKKHFNLGSETILRQSISTVHDFAMNIIRSRKSSNKENIYDTDLLSRFIFSTSNDNSSKNSDEFLRDIIVSFILAGRDTTSSALAWFFWLLSSKPQVEQKIIRELKSIRTHFQKGPFEMFDYEEMREMQYLHAAITEVLRLYPPVALDARVCMERL